MLWDFFVKANHDCTFMQLFIDFLPPLLMAKPDCAFFLLNFFSLYTIETVLAVSP